MATNARQNVPYFLPFHGNTGYPKVSQYYIIRTLSILLQANTEHFNQKALSITV